MRKFAVFLVLIVVFGAFPSIQPAQSLTVCPGGGCEVTITSVSIKYQDLEIRDNDVSENMVDVPIGQIDPGIETILSWNYFGALGKIAYWELRYGTGDIPSVIVSNKLISSHCLETDWKFQFPKDLKGKYLKFWIWAFDNKNNRLGGANTRPISLTKTLIPPIGYVSDVKTISPQTVQISSTIVATGNSFPLQGWIEWRKNDQDYSPEEQRVKFLFDSFSEVQQKGRFCQTEATGLLPNTEYFCHFVLASLSGEFVSQEVSFKTPIANPYAQTDWPSDISIKELWYNPGENSFSMNATFIDWGGDDHFYYYFEGTCLDTRETFIEPSIPQRVEKEDHPFNQPFTINWKMSDVTAGRLYQYRVVVYNSNGNLVKGDYKYLSPSDATYRAQLRTEWQLSINYVSAMLCGTVLDLGNQKSIDVTFQMAAKDIAGLTLRPSGKIVELKSTLRVSSPQTVKMPLDNIYSYLEKPDNGFIYRIKASNSENGLVSYGDWQFLNFTGLFDPPHCYTPNPNRKRDVGNNWLNMKAVVVGNWSPFKIWFEVKQKGSKEPPWQTPPQYVLGGWDPIEFRQTIRNGEESADDVKIKNSSGNYEHRKFKIEPGQFYEYTVCYQVVKEASDPEFVIARGEKYFLPRKSDIFKEVRTWFGASNKKFATPRIVLNAELSGLNTIKGTVTIEDFGSNDYVLVEIESYQLYYLYLINPSYGNCFLLDKKMPSPDGKAEKTNPDYGTSTAHYAPGYKPTFTFTISNLLYGEDFVLVATGQGNSGLTGFSNRIQITTQSTVDEKGNIVSPIDPKFDNYNFVPRSLELDETTKTYTAQFEINVTSMGSYEKFSLYLSTVEIGENVIGDREKHDTVLYTDQVLVEKPGIYKFTAPGLRPGKDRMVSATIRQGQFLKCIRSFGPLLALPPIPPDLKFLPAEQFIYNKEKNTFIVGVEIKYGGSADEYALRFVFGLECKPEDMKDAEPGAEYKPGMIIDGTDCETPWRTCYSSLQSEYFYDELVYTKVANKNIPREFAFGKDYVVYIQYKDLKNGEMTSFEYARFSIPEN